MSYVIIAFVVLSLLGSIMWVKPTKRDRLLAKIRMDAKKIGYQIQLTKLTFPREHGMIEPRVLSTAAYRLLRGKIEIKVHNDWKSWRVVRCQTNACEGLVSGWGWVIGERLLSEDKIDLINEMLSALPDDVIGVESTPIHVSVFWGEKKEENLTVISKQLERMISEQL